MARRKIPATEEVTCDVCRIPCTCSNAKLDTVIAITQSQNGGGGTHKLDLCDICAKDILKHIGEMQARYASRDLLSR